MNFRNKAPRAEKLAAQLRELGVRALVQGADLTDPESLGAMMTAVCVNSEVIAAAGLELPSLGKQLWIQAEGVLATIIYSGVVTFILLKIVDVIIGLRVNEEQEREGLDITQHGERVE